jgi:hypothetical protein
VLKECGERGDEVVRVGVAAPVIPAGRREHHPRVVLPGRRPGAHDPVEVPGVLGDDDSIIQGGDAQQVFVVERCQLRIVGGGQDIVSAVAQGVP